MLWSCTWDQAEARLLRTCSCWAVSPLLYCFPHSLTVHALMCAHTYTHTHSLFLSWLTTSEHSIVIMDLFLLKAETKCPVYLFSPSNLEWLKNKRSWLKVPSGEDLQVLELQGYKGRLGLSCAGKSKIKTHSSVDYHGQTKLLVFSLGPLWLTTAYMLKSPPSCF